MSGAAQVPVCCMVVTDFFELRSQDLTSSIQKPKLSQETHLISASMFRCPPRQNVFHFKLVLLGDASVGKLGAPGFHSEVQNISCESIYGAIKSNMA